MLFWRKKSNPDPYLALIDELLEEQRTKGVHYWYNFKLKESPVGRRLAAMEPEVRCAFVLAAVAWLGPSPNHETWVLREAMIELLRSRLPLGHDDVISLLDWSLTHEYALLSGAPQMIKVVEDYLKDHEMTPELREKIGQLSNSIVSGYTTAETRTWSQRLRKLGGLDEGSLPITSGEAWSDVAIEDVERMNSQQRSV